MSTAQYPNRDALQHGLNIYRKEMSEFIVRYLRQRRGTRINDSVSQSLTDNQSQEFESNLRENDGKAVDSIEIGFIPPLIEKNWGDVFQHQFRNPRTIRNTLRVIRDLRNDLSHDKSGLDVPADRAETGLYHISEALASVNRPEQQAEILEIRASIRQNDDTPLVIQPELLSAPTEESANGGALGPWRQVMTPNPDVENGSFEEAEFAANLQQVFDGTAVAVYGDPIEFFRRTYVTRGIRSLLVTAVRRISGNGGNPVIQTKTGFGGGKTHSLIALYHLIRNSDALLNATTTPQYSRVLDDVRGILSEAGASPESGIQAKVAVISGTWLSPNSVRTTSAGDPLNTLWGEMAWQLGGQECYEIVGTAARNGDAPGGEELDKLFREVGPCVILIDEIVNYARNADTDSIATFFQNLTEAVQGRPNVVLVVSLPVSTTEAGGERGMYVLSVFENLLNRLQSVMQVTETSNDEAFAVVRRRLFQDEYDAREREATCQAFYRMYHRGTSEYPTGARETRYLERLRQCYPIHPEIFDRLYEDWSLYHEFQRTRGVLRLMAQTISRLCADGDTSPLIMPANIPFNDAEISNEFIRLLGPQWDAVLAEVDRENSRTHAIDMQQPTRYGAVGGAARRIARVTFLGSSTQKATRGLDIRQINLGVVMPSHGVAAYRDAVSDMDGQLYHFYRGGDNRYYFDAQENLNKVANDRAAGLTAQSLDEEIIRRLKEFNSRNSNRAVIACPQSPAEVPDEDFVRIVILCPDQGRPSRGAEQDRATEAAQQIMASCGGDSRRTRTNTLLFLAAQNDRVRELHNIAKRFLAWDSINNDNRGLQITGDRRLLVRTQLTEADGALQSELENAYRWVMAPTQPNPLVAEYDLTNWQQISRDPDVSANAFTNFLRNEQLVERLTPNALNGRLAEFLWNATNPRYHISMDELWDLLTCNVYLRLRLWNRDVLEKCIVEGLDSGVFGRADGYRADTTQYHNLAFGANQKTSNHIELALVGSTLIVEAEMAALTVDEAIDVSESADDDDSDISSPDDTAEDDATTTPPPIGGRLPNRIVARKRIEGNVAMYDFNQIREEIARMLVAAGGTVSVEIVVVADKDDGFPENLTRSLRTNSEILDIDLEESIDS